MNVLVVVAQLLPLYVEANAGVIIDAWGLSKRPEWLGVVDGNI
jgi:hypothetical protein